MTCGPTVSWEFLAIDLTLVLLASVKTGVLLAS